MLLSITKKNFNIDSNLIIRIWNKYSTIVTPNYYTYQILINICSFHRESYKYCIEFYKQMIEAKYIPSQIVLTIMMKIAGEANSVFFFIIIL